MRNEPERAPDASVDRAAGRAAIAPLEKRGLESRVAVFGGLFLCLNVFWFGGLAIANPGLYEVLTQEDHWVEYLTAVWFLVAGVLLLVTALAERSLLRRGVYILGGIGMLFVAGEEISWGQRLLGFATPDALLALNRQDELNVHNINYAVFYTAYREETLLLCLVTGAAFICRKDALLGFPLPSIPLAVCFLVTLYYQPSIVNVLSFGIIEFIAYQETGLLLLFASYTVFTRQYGLLAVVAAAIALALAFLYVNYHNAVSFGGLYEVSEYLFGIVCLGYALELLLAQGRAGALARLPWIGRQLAAGRRLTAASALRRSGLSDAGGGGNDGLLKSPWLTVCCLIIAGSIGLMVWQSYTGNVEERRLRSIMAGTAGEPVIRATFDVYLKGNELTYFKESCHPADTEDVFFLHLTPANVDDLPRTRRPHGFDNRDFRWGGDLRDGSCIEVIRLPDYPITSIRTGQYIPEAGWEPVWAGEIRFPQPPQ